MLAPSNLAPMAIPDFIAGFMFGMTGDNNLTEIEACYAGGETLAQEIELGIADIKKGGWDEDVQAALEFGLAILQIPEALKTCKNMSDDIAAIEAWAQIFTNPAELAATISKHYLFHKSQINTDIAAVESDWGTENYFQSGKDLADLMTLAIGPIETANLPPLNAVPDFTAGLIFGFTGDNHLDELRTCMTDVDPLIKDAQAALDDIKSGHVIKGMEDFGDIIWALPDAVSSCTGVQDDLVAIEEWAAIFKQPTKLAKTVSKNWLFHGTEAKEHLVNQKADWAAQEFFESGEEAAAVLTTLIGPVPTVEEEDEEPITAPTPKLNKKTAKKVMPLFGIPI